MPSRVAPPPPASHSLDPLVTEWRRGMVFYRVHSVAFGATEFNPGKGRGRFHPFPDPAGNSVPTLYGADQVDGALAETVFHNVPLAADRRRLRRALLKTFVLSTLSPRRELLLIDLRGYGLSRLGLSRTQLVDANPPHYERTAAWAQALHCCTLHADGLIWISRLFDRVSALLLFGDRVEREDLQVVDAPMPLYHHAGFEAVRRAADQANITILET